MFLRIQKTYMYKKSARPTSNRRALQLFFFTRKASSLRVISADQEILLSLQGLTTDFTSRNEGEKESPP